MIDNKSEFLEKSINQPRKHWKFIFNWDSGDFFGMPWWVTDTEEFREKVITPLLIAGVDAVTLGLLTTDVMYWDSDYAEYVGQYHESFEDVRQWEMHMRVRKAIETKRFQMTALLEEAHKAGLDVLASFRMNDTHDSYFSPENILMSRFKKEHPELLINDSQGWTRLCLDYAFQEVRDRRFNLTRETVERFDVDGVELDFMRNGFFFLEGEEIKNAGLMTELVERIKMMLDEEGKKRGKDLKLVVHVPVTQEVSLRCGLNVVEWIEKGLADCVIADEGCVPFAAAPVDFVAVAEKKRSCRIYSTCDVSWGNPERPEEDKGCDSQGLSWTEEQLRGWFSYQLSMGVDGVNLFNGHFDLNAGPEVLGRIFSEKAMEKMGELDKTFVVHNKSFTANMPSKAYPETKSLPVSITVGDNGNGEVMELYIPNGFENDYLKGLIDKLILRVKFKQLTIEDEIVIKVNSNMVYEYGCRNSAEEYLNESSYLSGIKIAEEIAERIISINREIVKDGKNLIEIVLNYRNPGITAPLVWKNAELQVFYSKP